MFLEKLDHPGQPFKQEVIGTSLRSGVAHLFVREKQSSFGKRADLNNRNACRAEN
jgi:hypothetical protein